MTALPLESSPLTRHTAAAPCPVCGGHANLPAGRGVRCAGFSLDNVAYCSREEYAGDVDLDCSTSPPTYRHRLGAPCPCGVTHSLAARRGDAPIPLRRPLPPPATNHDYYTATLGLLDLRSEGKADLIRRGLAENVIHAQGYRSLPTVEVYHRFLGTLSDQFGDALLGVPGMTAQDGRLAFWPARPPDRDGYVVPYRDEDGRITGLQAKILGGKYFTARGADVRVMYQTSQDDSDETVWLTEGATKAVVAGHLYGIRTFAVPGQSLAEEHVETLQRIGCRRAIVALDEDGPNDITRKAKLHWLRLLDAAGLSPWLAEWDEAKGIDDLALVGGDPRLLSFVEATGEAAITRRGRRWSRFLSRERAESLSS